MNDEQLEACANSLGLHQVFTEVTNWDGTVGKISKWVTEDGDEVEFFTSEYKTK